VIVLLFAVISTLGLLAALGTVLARNLVRAALYLVAFFFLIACQFVLLEAEFLAVVQVLVYIGAVAILMMFGIMLTRNIQGDETTGAGQGWVWKIPAAIAALGVLGVLVVGIATERPAAGEQGVAAARPWAEQSTRPGGVNPGVDAADPADRERAAVINNMAKAVGDQMMTRYAVPFEVAGLLLTAALVGAIALARHEGSDADALHPGAGAEPLAATVTPPAATTATTSSAPR